MTDLIYAYTPYINEGVFDALLKEAKNAEFSKVGGNSKCAIINNYAVLKSGNIPGHDDGFVKMIETLQALKQKGVNVVPILGYGILSYGQPFKNGERYDKGYIVQEKAAGKELLSIGDLRDKTDEEKRGIIMEYLKTLSDIPEEHFDKWVADYKHITDQKVMIDPSKASNFFYDKKQGFSFIDLNFFAKEVLFDKADHKGQNRHAEFILYSLIPFKNFLSDDSYFFNYLSPEEIAFAKSVAISSFNKNLQALKKLGVSEEDVTYAIKTFKVDLPKSLQKPLKDNTLSA